ncbi:MAG: uracil-DNA glycosylase [Candidatus Gracilibacteria bacterium]|nr:uracil-DNA glycosylase [Candidatus Gracilibacteria bacterium]MDQ7023076.1 uracil-DNA glycosylase [Candidatus Gracilibacteria bacterium]
MQKIPESYKQILSEETKKEYYKEIISFLESEKKEGKIIYPEEKNIFNALELTTFEDIRVVILGQDPYHGKNQAHGLAFSVPENQIKLPPSLKNIFKELNKTPLLNKEGLGVVSGNLEKWSKQGVLLLNTILTVEESKPASHSKIGWEKFTDNIIKTISEKKENIVFLLWGNYAISKEKLINNSKHKIIQTSHPSPLGAWRGFLGSKCFSETNDYLNKKGIKEVKW